MHTPGTRGSDPVEVFCPCCGYCGGITGEFDICQFCGWQHALPVSAPRRRHLGEQSHHRPDPDGFPEAGKIDCTFREFIDATRPIGRMPGRRERLVPLGRPLPVQGERLGRPHAALAGALGQPDALVGAGSRRPGDFGTGTVQSAASLRDRLTTVIPSALTGLRKSFLACAPSAATRTGKSSRPNQGSARRSNSTANPILVRYGGQCFGSMPGSSLCGHRAGPAAAVQSAPRRMGDE